jgi:hypothetical protein
VSARRERARAVVASAGLVLGIAAGFWLAGIAGVEGRAATATALGLGAIFAIAGGVL